MVNNRRKCNGGVFKVKKEDLKYAVQKIDYWYKKHIKFLTIITVPFNTTCIFSNIIDKLSKSGENKFAGFKYFELMLII